jgi:uncharacterized lipoprotein YmbA
MIRAGYLIVAVCAGALALGACGSAPPTHFYTLVPPAGEVVKPAASTAAGFQFELLPVTVPSQVDQPPLVVRQGGQGVAVLQGERWIAPLGDELRSALSANLMHDFNAQDVTGLPANGKAVLRIKLDVRRFDSVPGSYAFIEAAWSVRSLKGNESLSCASRVSEQVSDGYESLVEGHQRAVARLAGQIGAVAGALAAGQTPTCP